MTGIRDATHEWDAEVDTEAASLIRQGTPPHAAIAEATRIVMEKRKRGKGAFQRRP